MHSSMSTHEAGPTPMHIHPGSTAQFSLQPSPPTMFVSSHSSVAPFTPSPQPGVHMVPSPDEPSGHLHVNDPSLFVQVAVGSQFAVPSAHSSMSTHDPAPAPVHVNPGSTPQLAEQPSPSVVLPSS